MSHPTSPRLSVCDVSKAFGDARVLRDVSLTVAAGQVHGLVGHNGAGKTTLIEVLAGRYNDYSGTVAVDGTPVRLDAPSVSAAAGIAVIHQHFALVPAFTAAENIALGREPRRAPGLVDHHRITADAADLVRRYGLHLPLDVPVDRLSVAHQQLTEIARALAARARVLVMDEPTSRLAPAERVRLLATVRQLAAAGVGVLYVSHVLQEVLALCDTVSVLRNGALVQTAPAQDLTVEGLAGQLSGTLPNAARPTAVPSVTERPVLVLENFGARGIPGSTLTVHAGEVVGIAGLVGSGRTTLLEAVAGARPSHGHLEVAGQVRRYSSPAPAVASGVVLVPEDRIRQGLVLQRSVADNVTLSALATRFSRHGIVRRAAVRAAAAVAVRRYRITARSPQTTLAELSGGNQQKVLLARATETHPCVLLCDQPTAGVDIGAQAEIYAHLRSLTAAGVAIVLVSDELPELLALCDRIAVMRRGRLTAAAPAATLPEHVLLAALGGDMGTEVA